MNYSTGIDGEISRETEDLQRFIEKYSTINKEIDGDADVHEFARESLKRIYNDKIPFSDFSRLLDAYYDAFKRDIHSSFRVHVYLEDLIIYTDDTLDSIEETGKSVDDAISLIDKLSQNASFGVLSGEVIESLEIKYVEENKSVQGKCEHAFREDGKYCPRCGISRSGLDSILAGEEDGSDEKSRNISLGSKIKTILLAGAVVGGAYYALRNGC